jgi:Tol biopolymer transport system component
LSAAEAGPIPGTEGGIHPFWSPDSRAIGFFSEGKMKRIDVAGGPARIICDVLRPAGAAWHRDGFILFAAAAGPIQRVAESGGQPAPVTKPGSTERVHEWPSLLPDGKRFLYVGRGSGIQQIFAGSLDGGAARKVLDGRYVVKYVRGKGRAGYLLETRPPSLFAVPVKEDSLEPVGEPEVLLDNVESVAFFGGSAYSFSETGLLVFTPGTGVLAGGLEIVDRAGKEVHAPVRGSFAHAEFSPDGTRVAVDTRTAGRDVALVDLVRGTTSRFTFDPAEDWVSVWSPDSSMIYFISTRGPKGTSNIYRKPASGAGREELFLQTDEDKHHMSVSADNKLLMFESTSSKGGSDLWTVPIAGPERKPQPYLTAPYNESQPAFSPDGKFAAYVSDESGRNEVFVQNFPAAGGKWQISTNGGIQPRWRRDGKELVYMAADGMIMSVETTLTATTLQPGIPKALFDSGSAGVTTTTHFTMTPDAKTFGMHNRQSAGGGTPPVAVLNWLEGLGQKR